MKFKVGDRVTWKDGRRNMVGVVEQAYERKRTPNAYYMSIVKRGRLFMRYEPELHKV